MNNTFTRTLILSIFLTVSGASSAVGLQTQETMERMAERMFKSMDRNRDQKLHPDEILRMPANLKFDQVDKDKNNVLDEAEFHEALVANMRRLLEERNAGGGFGGRATGGRRQPSEDANKSQQEPDRNLDLRKNEIDVESISVDFQIGGMILDQQMERALAWGSKQGNTHSRGDHQEIAVIDLVNRKVLATKSIVAGIQLSYMDDKYVYIAPRSGSLIYRYDRDTLENGKRVFTQSSVHAIRSVGKEFLQIAMSNPRQTGMLNRESLEISIDDGPISYAQMERHMLSGHRGRREVLQKGFVRRGDAILDETSGELVVMTRNGGLQDLTANSTSVNVHVSRDNLPAATIFGCFVQGDGLYRSNRQLINRYDNSGSSPALLILSRKFPALFRIRYSRFGGTKGNAERFLEVLDLDRGEVLESWVFHSGERSILDFFATANLLVLQTRDSLHFIDIPVLEKDKLVMPLHFQHQKIVPWSVDQEQTLQLSVEGGTGERQFQLSREYRGLVLNSETGELNIDLPLIWKQFVKQDPRRNRQNLKQYVTQTAPAIVKRYDLPVSADQVPFVVPIHVSVSDEEANSDQTTFYPIVLVPRKTVENVVEEAEKAQASARRNQQRRAMENPRDRVPLRQAEVEGPKRHPDPKPDLPSVDEKRLTDLENRVRRVEAVLDAILIKLEKQAADK